MADTKRIRAGKIRNGIDDNKVGYSSKKVKDNGKQVTDFNDKRVKTKKIRMSFSKAEEQKLDKAIEREYNFSVMVMVIILALCFIVGISLGYILYRIAINGGI